MIRYEEFDSAIGLNWYEADPNLQQILHRMLEPADLEWCEPELRKIGALCGGPVAARAEVTDKNPPRLVEFDRWGERIDEVVHHPGAIDTKRDLWNSGVSGARLRAEAARRGRRFPAMLVTVANYMLSQAETGMLCAVGMTSGVTALVERFGSPEVEGDFSAASDRAGLRRRLGRRDVHDREDRRLGSFDYHHDRAPRRRSMVAQRSEVVLLKYRRGGDCDPRAARGLAGRDSRESRSLWCPGIGATAPATVSGSTA